MKTDFFIERLAPDVGIPEVRFEGTGEGEDDEYDLIIGTPGQTPEVPPDEDVPEQYKGLSKADLITKMEAITLEAEDLRGRSSEAAALREGIEALGDKLTPKQQRQAMPQAPGETEQEYQARFNEKFFDNPYEMMKDFQLKKLAPELQQLMGNNLIYARRDIIRDPEYAETFKKYEGEIEEYVQGLDPIAKLRDPDIYYKAHDTIVGRHWRDLIGQKVNEAVEAKLKEAPPPAKAPGSPYTPAVTTAASGEGSARRTIKVDLDANDKARAKKIGLTEQQYARYLARKRGMI